MIDLDRLYLYRENNRLEAKKAKGGLPKSIWESYSSFANTMGGIILLGVSENTEHFFEITGVDFPESYIDEIWKHLNDEKFTNVNILTGDDVFWDEIGDKKIVVINVPPAPRSLRPVWVYGNPKSEIYKRNGEGDYHCSASEISSLRTLSSITTYDETPLHDKTTADFDFDLTEEYCKCVRLTSPYAGCIRGGCLEILEFTGAVIKSTDGEYVPTVAGMLMFGKKDSIASCVPNFSVELEFDKELISDEVVAPYCRFSNLFEIIKAVDELEISDEEDAFLLRACIKEAIANSYANIDFSKACHLRFSVTKKSITVRNSGVLRVSDSKNEGGLTARNEKLPFILKYMGIGKGSGKGLPMMFSAWNSLTGCSPVLIQQGGFVTLKLPFSNKKETSEREDDLFNVRGGNNGISEEFFDRVFSAILIEYITQARTCSVKDAAYFLGCSEKDALSVISLLEKRGLVFRNNEENTVVFMLADRPFGKIT